MQGADPRLPLIRELSSADRLALTFAIAVVDRWQRHGVGGELMLTLRERALRTGIRRFTATMLASNRGALALVRRLAPEVAIHYYDGIAELSGSWQ